MTKFLSLARDFNFNFRISRKHALYRFARKTKYWARCWQKRGCGVKQRGLNAQVARVVCRIPWTLSSLLEIACFSRERTFTSFFRLAHAQQNSSCQTGTKTPKLYV